MLSNVAAFLRWVLLAMGWLWCIPGASVSRAAVEEPRLSSLLDYLGRSLEANPRLSASKLRYEAALQRAPQVSALPDPMIQISSFVEPLQTRNGPQRNAIVLSQRIPWPGKLNAREEANVEEAESLWHLHQGQQLKVAREVTSLFYEYGYTHRLTELTVENLRLLDQLEPIVEEKVRSGEGLNSLLQLKIERGRVDDRLRSLQQQRLVQSARLSELLARADETELPWPQWSQPVSADLDALALRERLERSNPELQAYDRMLASYAARRAAARLEGRPDLSFGINYVDIGDLPRSIAGAESGKDAWSLTLGVSIPLWARKNQAAVGEVEAALKAIDAERRARLNALRAELSSSLATLVDANRRLELYGEELLGLAQQAVENSRSSYQSGRTSLRELIESERNRLELQALYWRAAADAARELVVAQTLANWPIQGTYQVLTDTK